MKSEEFTYLKSKEKNVVNTEKNNKIGMHGVVLTVHKIL